MESLRNVSYETTWTTRQMSAPNDPPQAPSISKKSNDSCIIYSVTISNNQILKCKFLVCHARSHPCSCRSQCTFLLGMPGSNCRTLFGKRRRWIFHLDFCTDLKRIIHEIDTLTYLDTYLSCLTIDGTAECQIFYLLFGDLTLFFGYAISPTVSDVSVFAEAAGDAEGYAASRGA